MFPINITQESNNGFQNGSRQRNPSVFIESTLFSPSSSHTEKSLLRSSEKVLKVRNIHVEILKQCENGIDLNTKAQKAAEANPEPFKNV
ncbi:hypothetical protein M9Y10_039880 [Tritrichomonas musculus]|uniref:Uncharacterized protein n=1 Tax=Tritrichomonas musculus TaxID=1915356 RepID=A0ABR2GQM5_9EUKA